MWICVRPAHRVLTRGTCMCSAYGKMAVAMWCCAWLSIYLVIYSDDARRRSRTLAGGV